MLYRRRAPTVILEESPSDLAWSTTDQIPMATVAVAPRGWLSRLRGQRLTERVAGVDLVTASCRLAAEQGRRVFLLGAGPGVAEAAGKRLEVIYPGLEIVGAYSPPMGVLRRRENEGILAM